MIYYALNINFYLIIVKHINKIVFIYKNNIL